MCDLNFVPAFHLLTIVPVITALSNHSMVYTILYMQRVNRIISFMLVSIILGISVYLFIEKYRMGMFRYFDMDELAYLNWTAHMVQGALPYRDFLMQAGPGFLFLLAPIFWISNSLVVPFFGGRIMAFCVFFLLSIVVSVLFFIMRKRWTAVFIPFLLVFLPMPADKFLEIRPDTTAILFAMMGTVCQILWMKNIDEKKQEIILFLSGFSYGISLLFMQKTFFHVAIAGIVIFVWARMHKRTIVPCMVGGGLIGLLLLSWGIVTNNVGTLFYSIVTMPMELGNMAKIYAIPSLFYFRYIDIYYGISGWNWGFILNQSIWIAGLVIGGVRFIWSLLHLSRKENQLELFVSILFITQVLTFLFIMPFKHAQYLIPIAVFVVFYVADGINLFWTYAKRSMYTMVLFVFCLSVFLFLCIRGYHDINDIKYTWTNATNQGDIAMAQLLFQTIPKTEFVFDMVGLTLYYPQPYVLSLAPGQIREYVSRRFPPLIQALEKTNTKYIYQGSAKRVSTFSWEEQQYMYSHFTPIGDGSILVRNDTIDAYTRLWNR